jgi:hypothetical protein
MARLTDFHRQHQGLVMKSEKRGVPQLINSVVDILAFSFVAVPIMLKAM